jgi:hypothetical protein
VGFCPCTKVRRTRNYRVEGMVNFPVLYDVD